MLMLRIGSGIFFANAVPLRAWINKQVRCGCAVCAMLWSGRALWGSCLVQSCQPRRSSLSLHAVWVANQYCIDHHWHLICRWWRRRSGRRHAARSWLSWCLTFRRPTLSTPTRCKCSRRAAPTPAAVVAAAAVCGCSCLVPLPPLLLGSATGATGCAVPFCTRVARLQVGLASCSVCPVTPADTLLPLQALIEDMTARELRVVLVNQVCCAVPAEARRP